MLLEGDNLHLSEQSGAQMMRRPEEPGRDAGVLRPLTSGSELLLLAEYHQCSQLLSDGVQKGP